jgi:hypothetical protein
MNFIEYDGSIIPLKTVYCLSFSSGSYFLVLDDKREFHITKDRFDDIKKQIHKAKRLEIASKLVGLYDDNTGCTINLENCIKTAEELIKQNEIMK